MTVIVDQKFKFYRKQFAELGSCFVHKEALKTFYNSIQPHKSCRHSSLLSLLFVRSLEILFAQRISDRPSLGYAAIFSV